MGNMMYKVKAIKEEAKKRGLELLIQVDGGIATDTIKEASDAGVDICVAGTAVFKPEDAKKAIDELKALCK